jgi:hypothetical protein
MVNEMPQRHVLGISGGKDSAALAIHLRDRIPDMEYFFTDTGKELRETYEYLAKLEAFLGKPIRRLKNNVGFDHWLQVFGGFLPSTQARWCTRQLKLKPFEEYVGSDEVISYVAIRADEDREGYISTKPNIKPVFPFKEDGICKADVFRILEESGVGIPSYYEWRTRSGCYFCFFQRKIEWVNLLERHPDLYQSAMDYEKINNETGERFTWARDESLTELARPERVAEIKARHAKRVEKESKTLLDLFGEDEEGDEAPCLICTL